MARKNNKNRKGKRSRKSRVPRPLGLNGGFTISRRVPTYYLTNSVTFGVPTLSGGQGTTMMTTGGVVQHPIFGNNYSFPFAMRFTLDQLAEYTDLTGISDRYKIIGVKVKFQYNTDSVTGLATLGQNQPNIVPSVCWVPDYDDDTPLTIAQLNAKTGLRRKPLNNGSFHQIKIVPRIAQSAYNGSIVTAAYIVPGTRQFINSSYPSVPHYGLKGYIDNFYLNTIANGCSCITMDVEFTVQVKDLQ